MSFQIVCPCNRKLKLSDQFRGRKIECFCKKRFHVSEDVEPRLLPVEAAVQFLTSGAAPSEAAPLEPAPIEPAPIEPVPVEPPPVEAAPVEPALIEPPQIMEASVVESDVQDASAEIALAMEIQRNDSMELEGSSVETVDENAVSLDLEDDSSIPATIESASIESEPVDAVPIESDIQAASPGPPPIEESSEVASDEEFEDEKFEIPVHAKDPIPFEEVCRVGERPETGGIDGRESPLEVLKAEKKLKIIHQARVYSQFQEEWFHCYLTSEEEEIWGYCGMEKKDAQGASGLGLILGVLSLIGGILVCKQMNFPGMLGFILSSLASVLLYVVVFFWKRPNGYLLLYKDNERTEKLMEVVQKTFLPLFSCTYEIRGATNNSLGFLMMNQISGELIIADAGRRPLAKACAESKFENLYAMFSGKWFFATRPRFSLYMPNSFLPLANFESFMEDKEYGFLEVGAPGSSIDFRLFHAFVLMVEYDR